MESRVLKIDLSDRSYTVEEIPDKIIKQYLGGRGLGAYLLYNLIPARTDPLGEENHLIFTAGPASGTNLPFSSRTVLNTKSPHTGIYLRSSASGIFGHQMKKAAFWAVDIRGIADSPVYITINNQKVEFKDATPLWGVESGETQRALLGGLPAGKAAAVVIGPAGEKLVPYATVVTGDPHYRIFGRGGAGCVMGSKKLKGIVVSGDGRTGAADKEKFEAVRRAITGIVKEKKKSLTNWHNYGTVGTIKLLCERGALPTRNWQGGVFEGWQGIDLVTMEWPRKNQACAPFCLTPCEHYLEVEKGPYQGAHGRRPEYEIVYAFGSQCGVDKYDAIVAANQICNENGIDAITAGVTIGFAMECFEKGLIGLQDTDGIKLRFGNDEGMIEVLKKIASHEGFGYQLAKGVRRLSQEIKGSEAFAMHVKGLEFCGYECRGLNAQALQFAISNIGAHHSAYGFPALIEIANGSGLEVDSKGEQLKNLAIDRILRDSIPVCAFSAHAGGLANTMLAEIVSSLLGEIWSADNLNKIGTRIICQERLFNMRDGITRADDSLPARLLSEPKPDGPTKGSLVPLEELKDSYYRAMGWDLLTGNPTDSVLAELEIEK